MAVTLELLAGTRDVRNGQWELGGKGCVWEMEVKSERERRGKSKVELEEMATADGMEGGGGGVDQIQS